MLRPRVLSDNTLEAAPECSAEIQPSATPAWTRYSVVGIFSFCRPGVLCVSGQRWGDHPPARTTKWGTEIGKTIDPTTVAQL